MTMAACLLPDLGAFSGGAPSGSDASVDATPDAKDSGTSDGAADVAADVVSDDAGPCSGPLIVGANDPTIPGTDVIAVGSIDAYGYTAQASGTARCAWIHLEGTGGGLQVGVYSHGGDAGPSNLKAAGILSSPKTGWNAVVLDKPIAVTKGEVLWIGLLCAASPTPTIRAVGACPTGNLNRWSRLTSSLPLDFAGYGPNAECSAPFYLSP